MGALLGVPVALASRVRAQQQPEMDIRIIEGVISAGGGIFNALKAGISPLSLNTDEMLGMHCGLIGQLRRFGGADDYLNLYISSPPPPANADEIYGYLVGHYGPSPAIQSQLRDSFANLPYGVPGMYDTLFGLGGHDAFHNLVAGVYQYYADAQGSYDARARTSARPAARAARRAIEDDDPDCVLYPDICYPPPPPDPCDYDPVACYPPWGPIPGVAFPWADPNDPKTPRPVHGLTREDVCFYAQKGLWYLGQVAAIYNFILKRDGVLLTLAGEVILSTPVATEVLAAIGVGMIVLGAIGQIAC